MARFEAARLFVASAGNAAMLDVAEAFRASLAACVARVEVAEDAVPDDQRQYIQINADYFKR